MKLNILISFLLTFFCSIMYGEIIIKGKVTDMNKNPLAYANVFLKNSVNGSVSDSLGMFLFHIPEKKSEMTIICAYMGYETVEKEIVPLEDSIFLTIKMEPMELETRETIVTAGSFTAADEEGVALNSMDVIKTPGAAADIFRAVKSFPGLQKIDEGAGLFVRGGDISETVILLDDAVIYHPYKYESPTGGYFGMFSPFLLKGTFFSSGGYSARYGNALSGALSMESLDVPQSPSLVFGCGLAAQSLLYYQPLFDDEAGLRISSNFSDTKALFKLNRQEDIFHEEPWSFDLNLSFCYHPSINSLIKIFHFNETDKVGVKINHPVYQNHYQGENSSRFTHVYFQRNRKNLFYKTGYCYSEAKLNNQLGVMDLKIRQKESQIYLKSDYQINKAHTLRAGIEYFHSKNHFSGQLPLEEEDPDPLGESFNIHWKHINERICFFSEWSARLAGRCFLINGIRYEKGRNQSNSFVDPRTSIVYKTTSNSQLSFSFGRFSQLPDTKYMTREENKPDLKSSRALHFIGGYQYSQEDRLFRVECYYKKYKGLLLQEDIRDYSGKGHGYAKGVDVFLKDALGVFSYRISYSYLDTKRKWKEAKKTARPEFHIPHQLSLILNYDITPVVNFGVSFILASGKPYTSRNDAYHDKRTPQYRKTDITISYLYPLLSGRLSVFYLSVSNLFGRRNILGYRFSDDYREKTPVNSATPRSFYFGVSIHLL